MARSPGGAVISTSSITRFGSITRYGSVSRCVRSLAAAGAHRVRKRDQRAVPPQALERVEGALLLVLHVHDDLGVVEQHPAAVTLAFAAYRLGADVPQLVLDLVDDRPDPPGVGRRGEHESVRDHQLLGNVEGHDVVGDLVGGSLCGAANQLEGAVGGGHTGPSFDIGCWGTYRAYLLMYCTTPSGTRYHTGSPRMWRARQSVDEIASAGISTIVTRSVGMPSRTARFIENPGRVHPTKCARSNSSSASRQVKMSLSASAPVMK